MERIAIYCAVFICGAVVMIFEIVGSRICSPYFGSSTLVWTVMIGVIMGSLSAGYYIGGSIADRVPRINGLASIVFLAAVFLGITTIIKDSILTTVLDIFGSSTTGLLIGCSILFAPASIFLGAVSPYAVRLRLQSADTSGKVVGRLYAISTCGSIIGTFLAGLVLIPHIGTQRIMIMIFAVTAGLSYILSLKKFFPRTVIMTIIGMAVFFNVVPLHSRNIIADVDTAYSRVWIFDAVKKDAEHGDLRVRIMSMNNSNQSAMALDSDLLVNTYTRYYHLIRHFTPHFSHVLMLGGAGYSFPRDYLAQYPEKYIDVVEIDPGVTALAQKYFSLDRTHPQLRVFHTDGRVVLAQTDVLYDAILCDAFSERYSIPHHLTTRQAVEQMRDALTPNGVVIANVIGSIYGDAGRFFRAEYATYKAVFPHVLVFPVDSAHDGDVVQNIMIIATKSSQAPPLSSDDATLNGYLRHQWTATIPSDMPILTDDYAPVDYYMRVNQ